MKKRCFPWIAFLLLLSAMIPMKGISGCTSVCLTRNDHVVFGNNLDWFIRDGMIVINKRNMEKRGCWFENPAEWVSKYASITVNQEGREFPSRGMNEAGLVIGEMTLQQTRYPDPDDRPSVNPTQWIQYQLDNCATVGEVIATDRAIRIDKKEYPSHFFVCDSSGNCTTIEWIDGKLEAHTGDRLPIKVLANSPYQNCLDHQDRRDCRFAKAAEMLETYQGENPVDYVFATLDTVSQPSTVWTLVFDVKKLRLYFRTSVNCSIRFVDLKKFDYACASEVAILDVQCAGEGDMSGSMIPYSEERNAALVRPVYRQLEPKFGPFTEDLIQKVIQYPGTTRCADSP